MIDDGHCSTPTDVSSDGIEPDRLTVLMVATNAETKRAASALEDEHRLSTRTVPSADDALGRLDEERSIDCLVIARAEFPDDVESFLDDVRALRPGVPVVLSDWGRPELLSRRIRREVELCRGLRDLAGFREAVEHAGHAIMITDRSGTIEYVNSAFERTTGYDESEAVGRRPSILKSGEHDREFYTDLWMTILNGEVWEGRLENRHRSGYHYPIEQTIAPITNEVGDVTRFVAVNRDISRQKAYEDQLREQNQRLESFARTVAHDLRNPLNVVQGQVELARERGDERFFDAALRAASRMNRLIDELLKLAEQGKAVLDPEPVALTDVATNALELTDTLDATLSTDSDRRVVADETRLCQLLENLFSNAVVHAGPDVSVTVGTTDEGMYVADDGPGIPETERATVFESGYTTASEGTGFGLAIVKQIADAHGWQIAVGESEDGGARFEVSGVELKASGNET